MENFTDNSGQMTLKIIVPIIYIYIYALEYNNVEYIGLITFLKNKKVIKKLI